MDEFVEIVSEETATGIMQLVYDTILSNIQKADKYGKQWYAPSQRHYDDIGDVADCYRIIEKIEDGVAWISKLGSTDGDFVKAEIDELDESVYVLSLFFHIDGSADDWKLQMRGTSALINYGFNKLRSSIKSSLKEKLDGVVDDQFVFSIKDVTLKMDTDNEIIPLVVTITFTLTIEKDVRPGGKIYRKTIETTKIGK